MIFVGTGTRLFLTAVGVPPKYARIAGLCVAVACADGPSLLADVAIDPDSNPLLDVGANDSPVDGHAYDGLSEDDIQDTAVNYDVVAGVYDDGPADHAGPDVDADTDDAPAADGTAIEAVVEAVVLPVAVGATIVNLTSIISAMFTVGLALLSNVFFGIVFWIFQWFIWPHIKGRIKKMLLYFRMHALQLFRILGDALGILILLATPHDQIHPRINLFLGICAIYGGAVLPLSAVYYYFTRKSLVGFRTSLELALFATLIMTPSSKA